MGNRVRILKHRSTFGKGYLSAWSEEIYVVAGVVVGSPVVYKIKDLAGEVLEGTFYTQELQKVKMDPEMEYKIEKMIKK